MIGLIASEAERQGHDACFFSSLFFTKLLMEGVSPSVLRWIKGQGLQPHAQNGFFVVNVNQNHWVLVHALPSAPRPTLAVYDSAKSLSAGVDHQIVEVSRP